MRKVIKLNIKDVDVYLRVDKNNQVCDMKPRVNNLLTFIQGRPFMREIIAEKILNEFSSLNSEELKQLQDENIQRTM